jgi:hypothetical protein
MLFHLGFFEHSRVFVASSAICVVVVTKDAEMFKVRSCTPAGGRIEALGLQIATFTGYRLTARRRVAVWTITGPIAFGSSG